MPTKYMMLLHIKQREYSHQNITSSYIFARNSVAPSHNNSIKSFKNQPFTCFHRENLTTMEAIMTNQCLSFPTFQDFNHNSPIRQFCPAREELLLDDEMETWPYYANETPQTEVEEIIDVFFNMECYEKDNAYKSEENEVFDQIQEHGIIESSCYTPNIPMIMDGYDLKDASSSIDDLDCFDPSILDVEDPVSVGVDQGLQLVHLLLACAEAMGCRDTHLANSILAQIWPCVSPFGDSLHRVSYCFAMGLESRLSLYQNVNPNGSFSRGANDVSLISRQEKSEAFSLLHQTTPYISFGFMAANDAIAQASNGKEFIHIVDLGMKHNLQWPSLVKNLAIRVEGPPKLIRITGIIGDQDPADLENSMKRLSEEAYSLNIRLEFQTLADPVSTSSLTREKLDIREGEALFVNSILHLHTHVKESRGSLKTVLQSIKKLNPNLLTVVEQDANHNGPFFLGRFLESLHYYSAIFDSVEASLPKNSRERMVIEKSHFAEEIRNVVAYEGSDRTERHERADQWRRQLGRAGFQVVGLKCLEEVKMMVSAYGYDGYTLGCEKGFLQLGWKGRPIMLASAWQVNNVSST